MERIRGITCSLYNGSIEKMLLFFSNKPFNYFIHRCMMIGNEPTVIPQSFEDISISADELLKIAEGSLWELVLHIYCKSKSFTPINTYDDFIGSACVCCLIFYDCGLMDIYIKDSKLLEEVSKLLTSVGAEDIEMITDKSDERAYMY